MLSSSVLFSSDSSLALYGHVAVDDQTDSVCVLTLLFKEEVTINLAPPRFLTGHLPWYKGSDVYA